MAKLALFAGALALLVVATILGCAAPRAAAGDLESEDVRRYYDCRHAGRGVDCVEDP